MKCVCGVEYRSTIVRAVKCYACGVIVNPSRGLGDTIHKITTALHIPHCGGCEQRREALNKIVPYNKP